MPVKHPVRSIVPDEESLRQSALAPIYQETGIHIQQRRREPRQRFLSNPQFGLLAPREITAAEMASRAVAVLVPRLEQLVLVLDLPLLRGAQFVRLVEVEFVFGLAVQHHEILVVQDQISALVIG